MFSGRSKAYTVSVFSYITVNSSNHKSISLAGADACIVASAISRSESFLPRRTGPFGKSQTPQTGVCASP